MSEDRTDTPPDDETASPASAEANGDSTSGSVPADPRTAVAKQRAHVAQLRNWCRAFLADPAATGVLSDSVADEIRATKPAMSEEQAMNLFLSLAQGEPVPPTHPAFTPDPRYAGRLGAEIDALTAERDRLRQAFFALNDRLYPGDIPSEEELLLASQEPPGPSISELIAELEREFKG